MKRNILYWLFGIFLLAGCQQEELPVMEEAYGYLSLRSVVADVENVNHSSSRALPAIDAEELYVEIWEGEKKLLEMKPGEEIPELVKLPVGTYVAKAYNAAYTSFQTLEDGDLGTPVFYGEKEFVIVESEVPEVVTVEASLYNFGISFVLDEVFDQYFVSEGTALDITYNGRTVVLDYAQLAGETYVYFYLEEGNMPVCTLTSQNADGEKFSRDYTLKVENGKCNILTFKFAE